MRDVDRRIECQSLNQQSWDAIEERNAWVMRKTDAENQLLTLNGKLWRLQSDLQDKEATLGVALAASRMGGLPGQVVGGSVVAVLNWEIRRLKDQISDVEKEIAPFQKIINDAEHYIFTQNGILEQLDVDSRALGCDRLNF